MREIVLPFAVPFYTQRVDGVPENAVGFDSLEDAMSWQSRACGIACLRMIIGALTGAEKPGAVPSLGGLIKAGIELGAFGSRGWIHAGLVQLGEKYGVVGQCHRGASIEDLVQHVEQGRPCMASVTVGFAGGTLDANGTPRPPGGHLVVVTGVAVENNRVSQLRVHHPSARPQYEWPDYQAAREVFERSYSGNFMSFSRQ